MDLAEIRKKLVTDEHLAAKMRHKGGQEGKFWKLEEDTILKIGQTTPVHPHMASPVDQVDTILPEE